MSKCNYLDENASGFLVEYRGNFKEQIAKVDYACGDVLTDNLAVVSVSEADVDRLREDVPAISFIEPRSVYILQELSPSVVDNINQIKVNPYLNLTGRGVVAGLVDTGINYTNPEFIREDGTSRILGIWDQTLNTKTEPYVYVGSVYNNEDINKALEVQRGGGNPYDSVPSKDDNGHGTAMAGIIGARGYNGQMEGIANDCDFLIVKLLESPNYKKILRENNLPEVPVYNNTEVLAGIEFLKNTAYELRKPLVLFLGVGSNDGSHDGYGITSGYLTSLASKGGTIYVAGTGNQGNSEGHVSGLIQNVGEIDTVELYVPMDMKLFTLYIWIRKPNRVALSIVSPTGEETGFLVNQIITTIERNFYSIDTHVEVRIYDPEYLTGHQLFTLRFNDIKPGIWKFKLQGSLIFDGRYDIWLECKEIIPEGMKFFKSSADTTLAIPSTARKNISVAYYNGKTEAVMAESGRGFNANGYIKPDIATAGTNVLTISRDGSRVISVSGSSVATAITAGVSALFLQWAVVNRNDIAVSSGKLRSLLIYSADREEEKIYPNEEWGYGKLNISSGFDILSGNYRSLYYINKFYEDYFNGLFIRMPRELASQAEMNLKLREKISDEKSTITEKYEIYNSLNYGHYIVQYYGVYNDNFNAQDKVYVTKIDDNYAIVSIRLDLIKNPENTRKVIEIFDQYNKDYLGFGILYVQPPDLYSLQDISAVESALNNPIQSKVPLGLTGKGVVVGIIDTGIDYLNEEFKDKDGNTRIVEIWDQTIQGEGDLSRKAIFGKVYVRDEINKAIEVQKSGGNPYDVVPSKDEKGHGTHMAGIVGAAGYNPDIMGVAPECEYLVVKLLEAVAFKEYSKFSTGVSPYNSMAIFSALNYMREYAIRESRPLVILMPLGTTNGNHRGEHILNAYIESISKNVGILVVNGTGNEGMGDGHVSGVIDAGGKSKEIEMVIGKKQEIFYVGIWIDLPGIADLTLISPSGQATGTIRAILNQSEYYSFILEDTQVDIYFDLPEKFSGDELIRLYFYDIDPGTWRIRLQAQRGENIKYNAWMWQKEFVGEGTRFAPSDPYGTITIPADCDYTVSVAAFNQNNGNLLPYSGVALMDNYLGRIDFAAGGVNTMTVGLNNTTAIINGTSLSAGVGAGICALLFQWGIVRGNYPYMYSQSIKTFLRRGTVQRRGDVYPNQQTGYGIINLYKIFEEMT